MTTRTLARRLPPPRPLRPLRPAGPPPAWAFSEARPSPARPRLRVPSRGPYGPVAYWERPAPGDDPRLWEAVQRVQERRLARGISVTDLVARLERIGLRRSRETLSRVLNGKQPTTWETVEALAEVLGVELEV